MNTIPTDAIATLSLAIGSDAILLQESHGAAAVRDSQQIPTENPGAAILAQFGIEVGAPDPRDGLFVNATFPAGWRRTSTGHSMWTYLVPPWSKGAVFSIFYKAAFYDRSAFMRFQRRYDISTWDLNDSARVDEARVYDRGTGQILHAIPFDCPDSHDRYKHSEPAELAARAWADANLPANWREDVGPWLDLMNARV
jgi:hypothetical protein